MRYIITSHFVIRDGSLHLAVGVQKKAYEMLISVPCKHPGNFHKLPEQPLPSVAAAEAPSTDIHSFVVLVAHG